MIIIKSFENENTAYYHNIRYSCYIDIASLGLRRSQLFRSTVSAHKFQKWWLSIFEALLWQYGSKRGYFWDRRHQLVTYRNFWRAAISNRQCWLRQTCLYEHTFVQRVVRLWGAHYFSKRLLWWVKWCDEPPTTRIESRLVNWSKRKCSL